MADEFPELVSVVHFSPTEIARQTEEIVATERRSRQMWWDMTDPEKAVLLYAIRATLCRLLESPDWVDGSLTGRSGGRIQVSFVVDLTEIADSAVRQEMEMVNGLRHSLEEQAARLRGAT